MKNRLEVFKLIVIVFSCVKFSSAEYCKNKSDILFDEKTVSPDEWDVFFKRLYSSLTTYNVQKDTSKYNVQNIHDWGVKAKPQNLIITKENLKNFLDKIKNSFDISQPNNEGNQGWSQIQIDKLNNILDATLKTQLRINCTEESITVTGNFISLKKARQLYDSYKKEEPLCEMKGIEKKQSIKIFASNIIFIDTDIIDRYIFPSLEKLIPLIFIAPTWEVIGKRKFNLYGVSGGDYKYHWPDYFICNSIKTVNLEKHKDIKDDRKRDRVEYKYPTNDVICHDANDEYTTHRFYDGRPKHGLPGLPGKRGGTFIGIGRKFINTNKLVIDTSGGLGSSGMHGSDGISLDPYTYTSIIKTHRDTCIEACKDDTIKDCVKLTESNEQLQRGGNGGKGGIGGAPGNITIIEFDSTNESKSEIIKISETGKSAKDGNGGLGEVAEVREDTFKPETCYVDSYLNKIDKPYETLSPFADLKNGPTGEQGLIEFKDDIDDPVINISEAKFLKEYQDHFRRNYDINMIEYYDIAFEEKLNNYAANVNAFNVDDLYDELVNLEEKYYQAKKHVDISSQYELLLKKINAYGSKLDRSKDYSKYKLLEYLYLTTLSRKNSMKKITKAEFDLNVPEFLSFLEKEFEKLMDITEKVKKNNINDNNIKFFKDYNKEFDLKKKNVNNVTMALIEREMADINRRLDKAKEKLLLDVEKEKKKTAKHQEDLQESRDQFLKDFIILSVFEVVKTANAALASAGKKGQILSAIAEPIIGTAESFFADDVKERDKKVSEIQKSIESSSKVMKDQFEVIEKEKLESKRNFIKTILREKGKYKDVTKTTYTEEDIKFMDETALEKVKDSLHVEFTGLKHSKKDKSKTEKLFNFYDKHEKLFSQTPGAVMNVWFAYQDFTTKKENLTTFIEQNQVVLKNLNEFSTTVYPVISSKLKKLVDNFGNFGKNANRVAKIDFNLFKYDLQLIIRELSQDLKKLIGSYESWNDVFFVIEKLDLMLPFLMESNSVSEYYQDQHKFVNMIERVSLTPQILSDEAEIKITELKEKIYSSILLKKFEIAQQALERYLFPCGGKVLANFKLPETLKIEKNVRDNVKGVRDELIEINKNLKKNKYQGNSEGDFGLNRNFHENPFFVWKNKEYKDTIMKLLSGEEVYLYADIMKQHYQNLMYKTVSKLRKNAVKIKYIALNFKLENSPLQKELNELLESFRFELTHMGDSRYKLNNKIYTIKSEPLSEIRAKFARTANGKPSHMKDEYKKIENVSLSPYATWKIKLIDEEVPFKNLTMIAKHADLELIGSAHYVDLEEDQEYKLGYDFETLQVCDLPPVNDI